jgi:hypothetical protein
LPLIEEPGEDLSKLRFIFALAPVVVVGVDVHLLIVVLNHLPNIRMVVEPGVNPGSGIGTGHSGDSIARDAPPIFRLVAALVELDERLDCQRNPVIGRKASGESFELSVIKRRQQRRCSGGWIRQSRGAVLELPVLLALLSQCDRLDWSQ